MTKAGDHTMIELILCVGYLAALCVACLLMRAP